MKSRLGTALPIKVSNYQSTIRLCLARDDIR
jgi:hypothetical protein